MSNTTPIPNRNQALNKETLASASHAKEIPKSQQVIDGYLKSFEEAPVKFMFNMPPSRRKLLNRLLWFYINCGKVNPSYEGLAKAIGMHVDTVRVGIHDLKRLGLIDWVKGGYKVRNSYSLSESIFLPNVTRFLKCLFPCLSFLFFTCQLLSYNSSDIIKVENPRLYINSLENEDISKRLFRNSKLMSSNQAQDFVKKLPKQKKIQKEGYICNNLSDQDINFMRKDFAVQELEIWKEANRYALPSITDQDADLWLHEERYYDQSTNDEKPCYMRENDGSFAYEIQETCRIAESEQRRRESLYGKRIEKRRLIDPRNKRKQIKIQQEILDPIHKLIGNWVTMAGLIKLSVFSLDVIKHVLHNPPEEYYKSGYHDAYQLLYEECVKISELNDIALNKTRMREFKKIFDIKAYDHPTTESPPKKERFLKVVGHQSPNYSGEFFDRARQKAAELEAKVLGRNKQDTGITEDFLSEDFLRELEELKRENQSDEKQLYEHGSKIT